MKGVKVTNNRMTFFKERPIVGSYTGNPYVQISYASPSWSGFIKCDELTRLKAIVSKASHMVSLFYATLTRVKIAGVISVLANR